MMVRVSMLVKIFSHTDYEELEKMVNAFLVTQKNIINIKLATSETKDANIVFTVLIMY